MKRRCFKGLTDTGLVRPVNQDDYYTDPEGKFFIVADGMGGHAGGQEASQIATKVIQQYFKKHWESDLSSPKLLEQAVLEANQAILKDQSNHPERSDMGTTVVVFMIRDGKSWYSHVGDSRFYRQRGTQLEQLTEDHTWVAKAMKMGDLSKEQAAVHPWRHVLSQCLGRQDLPAVEVKSLDIQAGDRLLLCSDGLSGEVPEEIIRNCLHSMNDCEALAKTLIHEAKEHGGADNITVVAVIFDNA